jgi:CHAD domain-containing protein
VTQTDRLIGGRNVSRSRPGRPWLRLVRATSDTLGPISPELALVDQPLAAAVRLTPDAVVVAATERPPPQRAVSHAVQLPPRRRVERQGAPATAVRYDTRDLLLEQHGLKLELSERDGLHSWRLTAARGETVVALEDGDGLPAKIESLLRTVIRGGELMQVPVRSSNPELRRLEDQVAKQRHSLVQYDVGSRIASDPESLHQLRVAARRTRAFLKVTRDLVDGDWADEINGGMRELGRASNEARDVDILLDNLRDQIRTLDLRDQTAGGALISALERDRKELQHALVAVLDSRSYERVLDRMSLPAVPAGDAPPRKLDRLAARELRRLVTRVRKLGKRPDDDALHALRINVKRVRYAAELGGAPSGKRTGRVIAAATRMQDILGEHQDAVVGEERLRELAYRVDESGVAFVAGRLAERERVKRDQIHDRLPSAWEELHKLARRVD